MCVVIFNGMLKRAGTRNDLGTYHLGEAQSMDVYEGSAKIDP